MRPESSKKNLTDTNMTCILTTLLLLYILYVCAQSENVNFQNEKKNAKSDESLWELAAVTVTYVIIIFTLSSAHIIQLFYFYYNNLLYFTQKKDISDFNIEWSTIGDMSSAYLTAQKLNWSKSLS